MGIYIYIQLDELFDCMPLVGNKQSLTHERLYVHCSAEYLIGHTMRLHYTHASG